MGNSSSSGSMVKWKTGVKTESINAPFSSITTFEKLSKLSEFKDFICRNLYSNYLIDSILNSSETSLDGIDGFKSLSPMYRKKIKERIDSFERTTVAGVNVSNKRFILLI